MQNGAAVVPLRYDLKRTLRKVRKHSKTVWKVWKTQETSVNGQKDWGMFYIASRGLHIDFSRVSHEGRAWCVLVESTR